MIAFENSNSRRPLLVVIGLVVSCQLLVVSWAQAPVSFADQLYPIFEKAGCRGCHAPDGVASATRLHFPAEDAPRELVEAFGMALADLVDRADPSGSLLITKPTNRVRHTGGDRVKPGSPEEKILVEWVRNLASLPES